MELIRTGCPPITISFDKNFSTLKITSERRCDCSLAVSGRVGAVARVRRFRPEKFFLPCVTSSLLDSVIVTAE